MVATVLRRSLPAWIAAVALAGCALTPVADPSSVSPAAVPSVASPTPASVPAPSQTPTPEPPSMSAPETKSLDGETHDAWAFAPLADPSKIVVEGSTPRQRAWSTSKVLIIAAFFDTVLGGDPGKLTASQEGLIVRAFTESDMTAYRAIRAQIPGGFQGPAQEVLRSIGDTTTTVPSVNEGTMTWTVREQLRFMLALAAGRVVNAEVSRYILDSMHPVASQSWGLGTVGASAFKGGWLTAATETRQMGILDGYAVVIVTDAGPAEKQSDGDSAHVEQLNVLAGWLKARLAAGG